MNNIQNSYFAGLIDGEGHISIHYQKDKPKGFLVVEVKMTCKKTIEALKSTYGGSVVLRNPPKNTNHKQQWRWRVKCKKARIVLLAIYPYLITKRDSATEAIQHAKERGLM